jgi:ADP-ribose pyrophosphatase
MEGDRATGDQAWTAADVEVLEREAAYEGYFRIDRYRLRHVRFGGGWSEPMRREIFERGHAVAIVLYEPERDLLVLIEQFRPGAFVAAREPHLAGRFTPWLIEIVAGIIDPGEGPEDVVRREAMEEAGCQVLALEPILPILASPGGTSETVFLYLGRIKAPETGGIHGLDDEHEDIRVIVAPSDDVFSWMDGGRIVNGPGLVALFWFRVHRDAIRTRWLESSPA